VIDNAYKRTCIPIILLIYVYKPIEAVTYNVIWDTHTAICSRVTRVRLQVLERITRTSLIILLAARRAPLQCRALGHGPI